VPLFQRVLHLLEGSDGDTVPAPPVVTAEVWAHMGVAMQSLDRVPAAIDSYKHAVALDPTLHVCFANLATLHAYLNEREVALEYIGRAITLDPTNATYGQIRQHLEVASQEEEQASGDADDGDALAGEAPGGGSGEA